MSLKLLKGSFLLSLLITLHFASGAFAQATINTDSLFAEARVKASAGEYDTSRKLLRQVLAAAPEYTDAALLLGRTYAWEEKFDSARTILVPLYESRPQDTTVLLALADVELWSGNPEKAVEYADAGLTAGTQKVPLLLVKARAYQQLQEFNSAEATLELLLEQEPDHPDALKLLEQVIDENKANIIRASYQLTTFNKNFSAWHLGSLEYTRITPSGKYLGRVSYADRYGQQSKQLEIDAYPALSKKAYLYLNAGVSDGNLFPEYRLGGELYHMLPYKFEASAGVRVLSFPEENVVLYTGYVGKYFRRQWVSLRPFLQQTDGDWQATGILMVRQYFNHAEDHITLILSQGSTPLTQVGLEEIGRLGSSRIGLEAQIRAGKNFILTGLFSYEYEEYALNAHRNRYTTGLSIQHEF